jgi:hypothetical protein
MNGNTKEMLILILAVVGAIVAAKWVLAKL